MRPAIMILLLLVFPRLGWSQPARYIIARNSPCDTCIAVSAVQLVGMADGPGMVGQNPWAACNSKGDIAVATMARRGEIVVFDSHGRYMRTLGRVGSGPGEFGVVFPVKFGPGDSLHAFDFTSRRWTVFSPGWRLARTVPLTLQVAAAVPLSSGLVAYADSRTPENIGLPLHSIAADGQILKSFGSDGLAVRPDDPMTVARRVSGNDRSIWSSRLNEYLIEEWSDSGSLRRSLTISTKWFPPWTGSPTPEPPPPIVIDIQADQHGLLWIIIAVPDSRYRHVPPGIPVEKIPSSDEQFDTILDVIDPIAGRVLATTRIDAFARGFACERRIFGYSEDSNGNPRVALWQLSLSSKR